MKSSVLQSTLCSMFFISINVLTAWQYFPLNGLSEGVLAWHWCCNAISSVFISIPSTCVLSRWKFLKGSQSQFCQTYIWNTAVKCPLSEAVGDIYNFQCSTYYATEECDIPTCILLMDNGYEWREGRYSLPLKHTRLFILTWCNLPCHTLTIEV